MHTMEPRRIAPEPLRAPWLALGWVAALGLSACSDGAGVGTATVEAELAVGPEGLPLTSVLQGTHGSVRVEVPDGALRQRATLRIRASDEEPPLPSDAARVGEAFHLSVEPPGSLAGAIAVELPVDAAARVSALGEESDVDVWESAGGEVRLVEAESRSASHVRITVAGDATLAAGVRVAVSSRTATCSAPDCVEAQLAGSTGSCSASATFCVRALSSAPRPDGDVEIQHGHVVFDSVVPSPAGAQPRRRFVGVDLGSALVRFSSIRTRPREALAFDGQRVFGLGFASDFVALNGRRNPDRSIDVSAILPRSALEPSGRGEQLVFSGLDGRLDEAGRLIPPQLARRVGVSTTSASVIRSLFPELVVLSGASDLGSPGFKLFAPLVRGVDDNGTVWAFATDVAFVSDFDFDLLNTQSSITVPVPFDGALLRIDRTGQETLRVTNESGFPLGLAVVGLPGQKREAVLTPSVLAVGPRRLVVQPVQPSSAPLLVADLEDKEPALVPLEVTLRGKLPRVFSAALDGADRLYLVTREGSQTTLAVQGDDGATLREIRLPEGFGAQQVVAHGDDVVVVARKQDTVQLFVLTPGQ